MKNMEHHCENTCGCSPKKGPSTCIIGGVIILVLVLAGVYGYYVQNQNKADVMMKKEDVTMNKTDAMMKKEDVTMNKTDVMMQKQDAYIEYTPEILSQALSAGKKVALFFHATWCPSCRALDSAIATNLSSIPSDTVVLKVDYDTYSDLRQKYGVRSQHTTIQLNADGTEKSRKLGGRTIAEILE